MTVRRALLGPPLRSSAIARERMRKLVALPVLSADALSSVAYGPEAMLAVLVLAGSAGLSYTLPIAGDHRPADARRRRVLSPNHPRLPAWRRLLHRRQ